MPSTLHLDRVGLHLQHLYQGTFSRATTKKAEPPYFLRNNSFSIFKVSSGQVTV